MEQQTVIYLALVLVGLCMGSFAGATVWRLRARQLIHDKKYGEPIDNVEYKKLNKLTKTSIVNDRSQCLNCSYNLKWYDLIPVISWVLLRGRCRNCRKPIGWLEPAMELGMAAFFVLSFRFWPYQLVTTVEIARLIIWLISGVGLAVLFVYDQKWSILPDKVNYIVIGLGLLGAGLVVASSSDITGSLLGVVGSVAILSGIYWLIFTVSKGAWVGFGDVKLGLGLGLLLADWRLAFIALFAANLLGCLIVIPAMLAGKLKRDSRIPFGPLLIAGFIVAGLAGNYIVNLFFSSLQ